MRRIYFASMTLNPYLLQRYEGSLIKFVHMVIMRSIPLVPGFLGALRREAVEAGMGKNPIDCFGSDVVKCGCVHISDFSPSS